MMDCNVSASGIENIHFCVCVASNMEQDKNAIKVEMQTVTEDGKRITLELPLEKLQQLDNLLSKL